MNKKYGHIGKYLTIIHPILSKLTKLPNMGYLLSVEVFI